MVVEPLKRQFGHSFPKTLVIVIILAFSTIFTLYINKDAINFVNIDYKEITPQNIDSFNETLYKAIINNVTINPAGVVCNKDDSCIATLVEFENKIVIPINKNEITTSPRNFSGSLYSLDPDQIEKLSSQFDADPSIDGNILGNEISAIILSNAKTEEVKLDSNTKIFQHSVSMSRRGVYSQTIALGILVAAFMFIILNRFLFR